MILIFYNVSLSLLRILWWLLAVWLLRSLSVRSLLRSLTIRLLWLLSVLLWLSIRLLRSLTIRLLWLSIILRVDRLSKLLCRTLISVSL